MLFGSTSLHTGKSLKHRVSSFVTDLVSVDLKSANSSSGIFDQKGLKLMTN